MMNDDFFYEPGSGNTIELFLRRTLQRQKHPSAAKGSTQMIMIVMIYYDQNTNKKSALIITMMKICVHTGARR
jgi:hypothetical protein